jgi:hypothetical protein
MGQETYREFAPLVDAPTPRPSRTTTDKMSDNDAEYCRIRAEEEFSLAFEARHPAARAAHLEMAALYVNRAVAAR